MNSIGIKLDFIVLRNALNSELREELNYISFLTTNNLQCTVRLNRRLRAPNFTANRQAVEREAVELVLQR